MKIDILTLSRCFSARVPIVGKAREKGSWISSIIIFENMLKRPAMSTMISTGGGQDVAPSPTHFDALMLLKRKIRALFSSIQLKAV